MNRREALSTETPTDFEPGYTMSRAERDIEFLAFALGDGLDAFIEIAVWRAKRRRECGGPYLPGVIDHIQEPH